MNETTESLIRQALEEDLAGQSDITTQLTVPAGQVATAVMRARQEGVLAGIEVAVQAFEIVDSSLQIVCHAKDGDALKPGQEILTVSGSAASILTAERTALNFMTHLSGIATLTQRYVDAAAGTPAKILDTRKTLPGWRSLQKQAVLAGGGLNHRFGLYDAILIKDNHIEAAGGITAALERVQGQKLKIEIEVDTLEQLEEVLTHGGADIVMLDNMGTETLGKAAAMVGDRMKTEASGGVNLDNVRAIAETGVDFISVGALTHSAPALDIGLDFDV